MDLHIQVKFKKFNIQVVQIFGKYINFVGVEVDMSHEYHD